MFRVGKELPIAVAVPVPWFPLQAIVRHWKPHFRPDASSHESQDGIDIYFPRFFSVPGLFKYLDGRLMALGCARMLRHLMRTDRFDIIDAHFAYPDGYAASLLARWFDVPFTITVRGTEARLSKIPVYRKMMRIALNKASRIICVSSDLKRLVLSLGVDSAKVMVVGNGVDMKLFFPVNRRKAREDLGLPLNAPILISVGGLVERKGFHRVIDCLPELRKNFSDVRYIVVGGPSPEGDWSKRLRKQILELGLQEIVTFLGVLPPERLRTALSAADVFVLATSNEGWANVFLEAMACGLPVVTTDIGGNREVVQKPELGIVVPMGDSVALKRAIENAVTGSWNRDAIIDYASKNGWENRVAELVGEFKKIHGLHRHS